MPSELKYAIGSLILVILAFLIPGGRVMVLPFFFMSILAMLFASAQRSAARQDEEES